DEVAAAAARFCLCAAAAAGVWCARRPRTVCERFDFAAALGSIRQEQERRRGSRDATRRRGRFRRCAVSFLLQLYPRLPAVAPVNTTCIAIQVGLQVTCPAAGTCTPTWVSRRPPFLEVYRRSVLADVACHATGHRSAARSRRREREGGVVVEEEAGPKGPVTRRSGRWPSPPDQDPPPHGGDEEGCRSSPLPPPCTRAPPPSSAPRARAPPPHLLASHKRGCHELAAPRRPGSSASPLREAAVDAA
ncbi:unnamed protein product, partial [Urochloa humidicola]